MTSGWVRSWESGRAHLFIGHDGSRRSRLIASRWYVEVTVLGFYVNVGVL